MLSLFAGTSLLTGLISKFLKMSDPMIGTIASIGSVIAKPIYVSIYFLVICVKNKITRTFEYKL